MAFGEIDPRHLKVCLSVEFKKVSVQNPRGNTIIYRLFQDIWLHTQREDGINIFVEP